MRLKFVEMIEIKKKLNDSFLLESITSSRWQQITEWVKSFIQPIHSKRWFIQEWSKWLWLNSDSEQQTSILLLINCKNSMWFRIQYVFMNGSLNHLLYWFVQKCWFIQRNSLLFRDAADLLWLCLQLFSLSEQCEYNVTGSNIVRW